MTTATATPTHRRVATKEELDLRRIMLQLEMTKLFKKKLSSSRFTPEYDLKSLALKSMGTAGAIFENQKKIVALCEKHLEKAKRDY